jgi:hypothetical protein
MCFFGCTYTWRRSRKPGSSAKLPADARLELTGAAYCLPPAFASLSWPVSQRISATDATQVSGGRCTVFVSQELAYALWRSTEHRGAYVRLDAHGFHSAQQIVGPDPLVGDLFGSIDWTVHHSRRFRSSRPVNLQEIEGMCEEVRAAAR